jgi:hypothetical protein
MIDARRHLPRRVAAPGSFYSLPHIETRGWRLLRTDMPIEAAYLSAGGIMRYVIEQLDSSLRDGALKSAEEQRPR